MCVCLVCEYIALFNMQPGSFSRGYQSIPSAEPDDINVSVGGGGVCANFLAVIAFIFVVLLFPFSLMVSIKVNTLVLLFLVHSLTVYLFKAVSCVLCF